MWLKHVKTITNSSPKTASVGGIPHEKLGDYPKMVGNGGYSTVLSTALAPVGREGCHPGHGISEDPGQHREDFSLLSPFTVNAFNAHRII